MGEPIQQRAPRPMDLRVVFKSGTVVDLVVDADTAAGTVRAFMGGRGERVDLPADSVGARLAVDPSALCAVFARDRG